MPTFIVAVAVTTVVTAVMRVISVTAIGVMPATISAVAEAAAIDIDAAMATISAGGVTTNVTTTMTTAVTAVTNKRHYIGSGVAFQDRQRGHLCADPDTTRQVASRAPAMAGASVSFVLMI